MLLEELCYHSRLPTAHWLYVDSAPFFLRPCCQGILKHDRHAGRRKIDLKAVILVQRGRIFLALGEWEAAMQDAAPACRREIATPCGHTPQPGPGAFA